jgi:hypothetical protein
MAFHPRYWAQPVRNGSRVYNYAERNRVSRFNVVSKGGAPNIDSACTGTGLGDSLRASDLAHIPKSGLQST